MKDSVYTQLTEYITGNQNKFYRLAYSYLNNKEAALDAVQNAVCKALKNYPSLRNPDYLKTWFYRVLVNECLAYRKKYRRGLPLEELLGKDYIQRANTGIREQMAERVKENSDNMYFKPDEGGFQTIDEHTKFYINGNKNPVIVFDKYEIAPGSMGMQEFEIAAK